MRFSRYSDECSIQRLPPKQRRTERSKCGFCLTARFAATRVLCALDSSFERGSEDGRTCSLQFLTVPVLRVSCCNMSGKLYAVRQASHYCDFLKKSQSLEPDLRISLHKSRLFVTESCRQSTTQVHGCSKRSCKACTMLIHFH